MGVGADVSVRLLGDGDARLKRLKGVMPDLTVPVWVASHADLSDAPRLSAVRARLTAALRADAARLRGR